MTTVVPKGRKTTTVSVATVSAPLPPNEPSKGKLRFKYLITHDGIKVSTTKCLQLIGGLVGSAVVIHAAVSGSSELFSIFVAYLAYTASIDGYTKFLLAKRGVEVATLQDDSQNGSATNK